MSRRILVSTCEPDHFAHVEALVRHLFLPEGGVEITQATQRDECERLACSGDFDLIVLFGQTTLYRPGFVGSPLDNSIAIIQAIKAKVATPIIALSTCPQLEEQPLSAIADVFVAMPYELEEFTAAVDRCLAGKTLRRRSDPLNPAPVRIVVVDDEKPIVAMMTVFLRRTYDVTLTTFTSSVEAWDELQRADPDMLIVGGIMPEMSGEQIVRGLMERKVQYPILVVSGFLSQDTVLGWFPDAPNIAFLKKPFAAAQFHGEVEKNFDVVLRHCLP